MLYVQNHLPLKITLDEYLQEGQSYKFSSGPFQIKYM